VDPLAFNIGLPPQVTFAGGVLALPPVASLAPHAGKINIPVVRMLSAAPNPLIFNLIASNESM
jgi:hypothetical protein